MAERHLKPPTRRDLEEQMKDALLQYELALRTYGTGLPTDWEHVAFKMACCLAPGGEDAGFEALSAALDQLGPAPATVGPGRRVKYTRHP